MKKLSVLWAMLLLPAASLAQVGGPGTVVVGGGSSATGTIGGSTGATDDAALCADGVGGTTLQACTQALFPSGTVGAPGISFTGDPNHGFYRSSADALAYSSGGVLQWYTTANLFSLYNSLVALNWGSSGGPGLVPVAGLTGVLKVTDASTGSGWVNEAGRVALAADYTNATAGMTNLTGLTVTLKARKYTWRAVFRFSDDVAADGAVFDFNGGTATVTDFTANCQAFDTALLLSADSTALDTDFSITTATGASKLVCDGSFEVNVAGTFIPRAQQEAHTTGTLTVDRGSYLHITDSSFN